METKSDKSVFRGLIVATVFILAMPVTFSILSALQQPSPVAKGFFPTNYVVTLLVTSPCPSAASDPKGPANLTATALNPTNVWLTWRNESTNQFNVQIYRRTGGTGSWWLAADVSGSVSNLLLAARPDTFYEFYAVSTSPDSYALATTTNPPQTNAVARPGLLQRSQLSKTEFLR